MNEHPNGLHALPARQEPVFHGVSYDGSHWIAALDAIESIGRAMAANDFGTEPFYAELYVGMPGATSLARCEIGIAGSKEMPVLIICNEDSTEVLWRVHL